LHVEDTSSPFAVIGIGLFAALIFAASPASAGEDCECVGNGKRIKEGGVICLQIGSSTTLSCPLRTQSQQHQLEEESPMAVPQPR
jgi:hypothetical protein